MRMHHFAIQVSDINKSVDFYTKILGFKIVETDTRNDGYVYLDLNNSGVLLELVSIDENKNIYSDQNPSPHLALESIDLDKDFQILKERGLVNFDGPYVVQNDVKILSVFDPDNYKIDIGQKL
ncbi:MAG: hypothetical protein APR63_08310 [Desulfuromonas sp. SDB]|nr:MAG: hypothetical protein APR63_08310 [Desulfuromonas sp. SDB]